MSDPGLKREGRGVAVGFLLADDRAAAVDFIARCEREGLRPQLVRAAYEIETPDAIEGRPVAQPTDYLTPAQMDAVHADLLTWLRTFPSTRLRGGRRLASWSAGRGNPPPVWAWVNSLAPYVQICLRTVRLTRAAAEAHAPVAWALLGEGVDAGWQAPLMRDVMRQSAPQAADWSLTPVHPVLPVVEAEAPVTDLAMRYLPYFFFRRRKGYQAAMARLKVHADKAAERGGDYDGHVVMISRGQRGAHWLESRARGRPVLIDEYSEGLPDALAELCVQRNWRLTLVWESPRPTVDGVGYADRWPGHVSEIGLADFGAIASQLRAPARARYVRAVGRLVKDKKFRAAMQVDGIDMLTPYEDYLTRTFVNLGVLMTTQAEAWRRAFETLQPDVVAGGRLESRPWINLAAAWAGARTASIKLGIGDEMVLSLMALRPDGQHEALTSPDALLVWGEHQVRHIARRLPENQAVVHAVGRTRSDTFVNEPAVEPAEAARVRQALGLRAQGPVIVWGGTCRSRWGLWPGQTTASAVMSPESWRTSLEALCRAAATVGAQVLVKPHPADDLAFVARETARMDPAICVLAPSGAGIHNQQLLAVIDVFVSSVSSMFAEALLAGKVAVNVWTPDIGMIYETNRFDLYSNIAVPARSADEAATAVIRLLEDKTAYADERARALAAMPEFFGPMDGGNAARAADLIMDLAVSAPRRRSPG